MRAPLILLALVLALAACGGDGNGGGGDGDASGTGLLDTREAEAPPDVRAGAGQPGGVGAEVPETIVLELSDEAGTVTLDELDAELSTITLDLVQGGATSFRKGTCASPGAVVTELGDQPAGFVQQEIPVGVDTLQTTPHVIVVGTACAEVPSGEDE